MRILIHGAVLASCAVGGPAFAQVPAQPTSAGPVQPWGLPPLPQGIGPVEKFADIGDTPQGKFLEGGAFDDQGNLWFVGIGSGWISYLQPDGLVPVVNCNPPEDYGQTCEPQGTRWKDGILALPSGDGISLGGRDVAREISSTFIDGARHLARPLFRTAKRL